jgi:phosphoadenosine phosphosulfate reductase
VLIPSPRHTHADLQIWSEREEADLAYAGSLAFGRQVMRSVAAAREFAARGPAACYVSWGKDSVALAGLLREAGVAGVPLVGVKVEPIGNPDCESVRDTFLASWPDRPPYHEFLQRCSHDDAGWHATGTLEAGFAEAEETVGTSRRMIGLRADESGGRKISMRHRGLATENSCRPLGWWSVQDVFAYLASRHLPVHPAYAMLGGGRWPREHLRVASLGGRRGDQFGRAEWEREYYGDVLNRLAADR